MKLRLIFVTLATLPLLWTGLAGAQSAQADSAATVSVAGTAPWTDTGLSVGSGDSVSITASGTIFIAGSDPGKTPAGAPGCIPTNSPTDTWVAPGLACWSLIARIGDNPPFEVGTGAAFNATVSGELFLGVNDNFFGDNSGAWTASITVSSAGCTSAPNDPSSVTNSATPDRGVDVSWTPPSPNCATIDHYDIVAVSSDGTPGRTVTTVPATATSASVGDLNLCTYYRFGVRAVGADQQASAAVSPAGMTFTQGLPDQAPKVISVIIQGINTHGDAGDFNPLGVDDYCTSLTGDLSALSSDLPLSSMTKQWLSVGTAQAAGAGAGNNMIDSLASTGGLVLPFSYNKAAVTGTASSPTFSYKAYSPSDVANTLPSVAAKTLDKEISSIHNVWPQAKIIVVGHSNGGLVAQQWWLNYGSSSPEGVVQVFALDSPLNGVAIADKCNVNVLTGVYLPIICSAFGVGNNVANFYSKLWNNQSANDQQWISLDETNHLFTPIGTIGDPVYDASDGLGGKKIGIVSQIFYT